MSAIFSHIFAQGKPGYQIIVPHVALSDITVRKSYDKETHEWVLRADYGMPRSAEVEVRHENHSAAYVLLAARRLGFVGTLHELTEDQQ